MQPEFMKASELSKITGLNERYFQLLASNNKIDWAIQPGGPNTRWLFSRAGFENWLSKGVQQPWPASTKGKTRNTSGAKSSTKTANIGDPLKQRLDAWQPSG